MLRIRKLRGCYHSHTGARQFGFVVSRLRDHLLWINVYLGRPGIQLYWLPIDPHLELKSEAAPALTRARGNLRPHTARAT
ncbi:MAG: hypothetical protein ACE5H7_03800 [Acidiferrobacterales bacterium]